MKILVNSSITYCAYLLNYSSIKRIFDVQNFSTQAADFFFFFGFQNKTIALDLLKFLKKFGVPTRF